MLHLLNPELESRGSLIGVHHFRNTLTTDHRYHVMEHISDEAS